MQYAIDETSRRREKQLEYNAKHGITPASVRKNLDSILDSVFERADHIDVKKQKDLSFAEKGQDDFAHEPAKLAKHIEKLKTQMHKAAENLEFEEAARLRDEIKRLENGELGL